MSTTRAQFKAAVNANIHNKIGIIPNSNTFLETAVREVMNEVDIEDTIRRAALAPDVFSGIYDYVQPTDLKSNKIVDFRQRTNRTARYKYVSKEYFDARKDSQRDIFTFENYSTSRILRISGDGVKDAIVDALDSTTTWAVDGDATTLTQETVDVVDGNALKFNLTAAGTAGGIITSTLTAVDATDYRGDSAFFIWAKLPTAANFTNVILRWGSSAADYWTKTVTTQADGRAFVDGWNLLRFDWTTQSATGSPTVTALDSFLIRFTFNGTAMEGVIVDTLYLARGRDVDAIYYSKYPWRTSAGVWEQTASADDSILNADEDAVDLYIVKATINAAAIVREVQADLPIYTARYYGRGGHDVGIKMQYMMKHPSQAKLMTQKWYDDRDTNGGGSSMIENEQIRHSR